MATFADKNEDYEKFTLMICGKNEIVTVKTVASILEKDLKGAKEFFTNLLLYICNHSTCWDLYVTSCSFSSQTTALLEKNERKLVLSCSKINEFSIDKVKHAISIQTSNITDPKRIIDNNTKENSSFPFSQKLLQNQIYSSNNYSIEETYNPAPNILIKEIFEEKLYLEKKKSKKAIKSSKHEISNLEKENSQKPIVHPKETPIFQPTVQSTENNVVLSDEEPLPKYLKKEKIPVVRKRVRVETRFTNNKGYLVTTKKDIYVKEKVDQNIPEATTKPSVKKPSPHSASQSSLNSFFKKA